MITAIRTSRIEWNGIDLEIRYEPSWSPAMDSVYGCSVAHIEVQSVRPERAKLPVTQTGYRSHFVADAEVVEAGGAIAYVRAWLDHAAQDPAWKEAQDEARQLSLL